MIAVALPLVLGTCGGGSEPAPVASSIAVTPVTAVPLASIGATRQYTAVVKDQNGNPLANAAATWTTSNAAAVTVTAGGLATAVANGTAQVVVTSGSAMTNVTVTVAQAPGQLVKVSGDSQTASAGQMLALPLVVRVNDATGHAIAGATVGFAAALGSGSAGSSSATTDASGQAQSTWTLGGTGGSQALNATVAGSGVAGSPVQFTAISLTAGATLAAFAGDNQVGLVGYRVNVRPAVRLTDAGSNPVAGAAVTFAVASGGGSLTLGTTTTNSNGVAQVGSWTLGGGAGTNTMTATTPGMGITGNPVTFADTGVAAVFNIEIQYYGPAPSAAALTAMDSAVAKWQSIIYRHFGAPNLVNHAANACGVGEPAVNQVVTDVRILATFDSIDGPDQILGLAGPCDVRAGNAQTLVGVMVFDSADVAMLSSGQLNQVILHEMGHVLGYGTLWNELPNACRQLSSSPPGTILDTYFSCPKARAAFDSAGGTSYTGGGSSPPAGNKVPVENCGTSPHVSPVCGLGTVNAHWREGVFGKELMTGFVNSGSNPLSIVSVAAQEDLGYTVNYAAADPYSRMFTTPAVHGVPSLRLGDDIRHGPIHVVDADGTVIRVISDR